MRSENIKADQVALGIAGLALLLLACSFTFEYGFGYRPCELCLLQRHLHMACAVAGLAGALAVRAQLLPSAAGWVAAALAILLIGCSGGVGFYQAGAEWHFWAGPAACSGHAFVYHGGALNLTSDEGPRCDVAQWRLFGLSMAGYNALISLPAAVLGALALLGAFNRRTVAGFA